MYICIYVYMYMCIYICIYVYMYICIYVYMYICIYVYMYICMHVKLVAGPLAIPFHLQIVNGDPLIPNQIGPPQPKRSCSLFWLRSHCSKRLGASLSPRAEIPEPACLCMEMPYTWTHEHTTHCDVIPRSSGLCKTSDTKNTLLKIMSLSFW